MNNELPGRTLKMPNQCFERHSKPIHKSHCKKHIGGIRPTNARYWRLIFRKLQRDLEVQMATILMKLEDDSRLTNSGKYL